MQYRPADSEVLRMRYRALSDIGTSSQSSIEQVTQSPIQSPVIESISLFGLFGAVLLLILYFILLPSRGRA